MSENIITDLYRFQGVFLSSYRDSLSFGLEDCSFNFGENTNSHVYLPQRFLIGISHPPPRFSTTLKTFFFFSKLKRVKILEVRDDQLKDIAWKPPLTACPYFRWWCTKARPLEGNITPGKGNPMPSNLSCGLFSVISSDFVKVYSGQMESHLPL